MGQQQLLLIVIGVIIVGIAVVIGIKLFTVHAEQSAQEAIVTDAMNIAVLARQYFIKPSTTGGGGSSFKGFAIPTQLVTDSAAAAKFKVSANKKKVTITGTPFKQTKYTWKVKTTVTSSDIATVIQ
jgi:Tfp pilus assembly protein PilE